MKGLADQRRLGALSKLLSTQSEGPAQRSTYFRCSTNSGSGVVLMRFQGGWAWVEWKASGAESKSTRSKMAVATVAQPNRAPCLAVSG